MNGGPRNQGAAFFFVLSFTITVAGPMKLRFGSRETVADPGPYTK